MKLFILIGFFLVASCGVQKETRIVEVPSRENNNQDDNNDDNQNDDQNNGANLFDDFIQPTMLRHCAICHPGTAYTSGDEDAFLSSAACRRVNDGTMPPRNSPRFSEWSDEIRDKVLEFCNARQ